MKTDLLAEKTALVMQNKKWRGCVMSGSLSTVQCRGVGRLCKYRVWESGGLGTNGLIFPPDLNSKPPAGEVLMPAAPLNVEP